MKKLNEDSLHNNFFLGMQSTNCKKNVFFEFKTHDQKLIKVVHFMIESHFERTLDYKNKNDFRASEKLQNTQSYMFRNLVANDDPIQQHR